MALSIPDLVMKSFQLMSSSSEIIQDVPLRIWVASTLFLMKIYKMYGGWIVVKGYGME